MKKSNRCVLFGTISGAMMYSGLTEMMEGKLVFAFFFIVGLILFTIAIKGANSVGIEDN